ncbi:MAG: hypothetical protein ABW038_05400, partial [Plantibacter flavus]
MAPRWAAALAVASALVVAPVTGPAFASAATDGAEAPVTWSVSPADDEGPDGRAWVERDLDPGDTITEHLALRNLGDARATFRLSAADAYFTETGRFNMLQAGEPSVDAGTWIALQPEIAVEAGATAVVPFTITVPDDATPGDHAAGVAASVLSSGTTADGTRVGVESRVGFRVMSRVSGEIAPALGIGDLTADYRGGWNPFEPGALSVSYAAENTGNIQLSVMEKLGDAETARGELLPGERRAIEVEPVAQWPFGPVTVEVELDASASPGAEGLAPTTASVVVWAVPWSQLVLAAGIVLLVVALLVGRRRSRLRVARLVEEARAE